jgi:hypothetical protein
MSCELVAGGELRRVMGSRAIVAASRGAGECVVAVVDLLADRAAALVDQRIGFGP